MEAFIVKNKDIIIENLIFSFWPVVSLIVARRGLKTWLKFEIFATILKALILVFSPATFVKNAYWINWNLKLDLYHLYLFTLLGAIMMTSELYPMFLFNSLDESVLAGHVWSKMLSNAMYFMIVFNSYKFENAGYKILCTSGSFYLINVLINTYFYFTTYTPRGHSTFVDQINNYTKLECLKGFVYGLMFFGLPNLVILGSATDSHRFLARFIGATMFCLGFQAHGVADFMYLKDKKTFILSRLIGGFFTIQAIFVGFYFYKTVTTARIVYMIVGYVAYTTILMIGYFSAKIKND